MINDAGGLAELLRDTQLDGREIRELRSPDGEVAFSCTILMDELMAAWGEARGLVDASQRWPLVTSGTYERELVSAELFYRPSHGRDAEDGSAAAIIARSREMSPDQCFRAQAAWLDRRDWREQLAQELEWTATRFGTSPSLAELETAELDGQPVASFAELDHWLYRWELQHVDPDRASQPYDLGYLEWFDPSPATVELVFLPTPRWWETLAYRDWFGCDNSAAGVELGTAAFLPVFESWGTRFEAELVANWGTMLQLVVGRPPTDPESAWHLAREQELVAGSTLYLPGVTLRDHARALLMVDRWFFHERP